jgi:hypothetical protein
MGSLQASPAEFVVAADVALAVVPVTIPVTNTAAAATIGVVAAVVIVTTIVIMLLVDLAVGLVWMFATVRLGALILLALGWLLQKIVK